MLATAVYFNSKWKNKFKDLVDEPFYFTPSDRVTAKMMNLRHYLWYYHNDELKFAFFELLFNVKIVFCFKI